MSIKNAVNQPKTYWMKGQGPEADVVVSSRIRIARNIGTHQFPHTMTEKTAGEVLNEVRLSIKDKELNEHFGPLELIELKDLTPIERKVLVEKHLISPHLLKEVDYRALILSEDEALSIMVNEEDHLRIQFFLSGLRLEEAWKKTDLVDDLLEKTLDFSFCEKRGYLTACPTNLGTGLRASVMVHLPALMMLGQINNVITAISQLGLAVRGYYGEGTKAIGNLFQISNQITLGQTEEEIVKNLLAVTKQVINQERSGREALYKENKHKLENRVYKSLGILSYVRMISSEEALKLLSDLRLGVALGILKEIDQETINELMVMIKPAILQKLAEKQMDAEERDVERARIIRSKLEKIKQ